MRQRLDDPEPEFDFPIMDELRSKGCTDYVAMPLSFSDGSQHVMTLTSDDPDGFSTPSLGRIFAHSGLIARILEVHALRRAKAALLGTYLGPRSAKRVLAGQSHRGDGETIGAAILYCDLRGSTALADRLPREEMLDLLNDFFERVVTEVDAQGGEVLKFIGDAVMAIFPVDKAPKQACKRAATAAGNILGAMAEAKDDRLQCVVALHYGDLSYGNVGAPARLDYTVAGRAANEVVRLQELCKTEGVDSLLSDTISEHLSVPLTKLGEHRLRGTGRLRRVYTLQG